ncbi:O-antigen polymerase [Dyadobacter flavalbus]|uniref:O-antigen polymerase n=2 Tax=Dyadobacter flavalbus TaxID=2579942 RepID=A0A5M8QXS1_9BACT|nr:O-antigen polymerase [Dyadobacter flavalbus]
MCEQLFSEIADIGESRFQSIVVLSFFTYCTLCLFSPSKHRFFHVVSIPVLTQFIQLFQKYSFTAGANSLWRLFPFILLNLYFLYFFLNKPVLLSPKEKLFISFWIIFNCFFVLISPNLDKIFLGGILLYAFTLPMYFAYFKTVSFAIDFRKEVEKCLCLLFVILGSGTFGLVFAGASYKGSDNLLATRNITDTNVTMAYFILLWPFVLLFSSNNNLAQITRIVFILVFTGIVIISFSRGAVLIIVPYLILTVFSIRSFFRFYRLILLALPVVFYNHEIQIFLDQQDMTYFWKLRFDEITSIDALISKLPQISGRAEIHAVAYTLFQQNPLFGNGIGSFEILGPGYREAHSLFYTLLAEQGISGTFYTYAILVVLGIALWKSVETNKKHIVLFPAFTFYLIFNHTVGSVFVIIPGKSITVNCIAPVLLTCMYFYAKSCHYSFLETNE